MHRLLITFGLLIIVFVFGWIAYADNDQLPAISTATSLPEVIEWHSVSNHTKTSSFVPTSTPNPPRFQLNVSHQPIKKPTSIIRPTSPPILPLQGWPVRGPISHQFSCTDFDTGISGLQAGCSLEHPYYHDGLDIAVPVGTPIRASITGTIIFAGADGQGPECNDGYAGYGLGIVIDNGADWQVLYAHLSEIYVLTGEKVLPDQVIGLTGNTGCSSGPHLHFGLRYREDLVDPQVYLE